VKTSFLSLAVGLCLLASTASAQIISVSVPRDASTASATPVGEKKFAVHVMASPMSKWKYNEFAGAALEDSGGSLFDVGIFSGSPNSDFLFAGETVFKVGRDVTVGVGGWHNKVGNVQYTFDGATIDSDFVPIDFVSGTLHGDLTLFEGHGNVFYKNVGVQGGLVHTSSKLTSSAIVNSLAFPFDIGKPLRSIEQDNSANDWDLYGIYKYGGELNRPFGISAGAGIYAKQGTTDSSQRAAENQKVFSGFVTASVDIYRGFGFDASYWYIAKTKAVIGGSPLVSDAASRFTLGFGYSFSK
jgi:hypothetical protein